MEIQRYLQEIFTMRIMRIVHHALPLSDHSIRHYVRRCDIRETTRFDTLAIIIPDRIFLVQLSNFVKKKRRDKNILSGIILFSCNDNHIFLLTNDDDNKLQRCISSQRKISWMFSLIISLSRIDFFFLEKVA